MARRALPNHTMPGGAEYEAMHGEEVHRARGMFAAGPMDSPFLVGFWWRMWRARNPGYGLRGSLPGVHDDFFAFSQCNTSKYS